MESSEHIKEGEKIQTTSVGDVEDNVHVEKKNFDNVSMQTSKTNTNAEETNYDILNMQISEVHTSKGEFTNHDIVSMQISEIDTTVKVACDSTEITKAGTCTSDSESIDSSDEMDQLHATILSLCAASPKGNNVSSKTETICDPGQSEIDKQGETTTKNNLLGNSSFNSRSLFLSPIQARGKSKQIEDACNSDTEISLFSTAMTNPSSSQTTPLVKQTLFKSGICAQSTPIGSKGITLRKRRYPTMHTITEDDADIKDMSLDDLLLEVTTLCGEKVELPPKLRREGAELSFDMKAEQVSQIDLESIISQTLANKTHNSDTSVMNTLTESKGHGRFSNFQFSSRPSIVISEDEEDINEDILGLEDYTYMNSDEDIDEQTLLSDHNHTVTWDEAETDVKSSTSVMRGSPTIMMSSSVISNTGNVPNVPSTDYLDTALPKTSGAEIIDGSPELAETVSPFVSKGDQIEEKAMKISTCTETTLSSSKEDQIVYGIKKTMTPSSTSKTDEAAKDIKTPSADAVSSSVLQTNRSNKDINASVHVSSPSKSQSGEDSKGMKTVLKNKIISELVTFDGEKDNGDKVYFLKEKGFKVIVDDSEGDKENNKIKLPELPNERKLSENKSDSQIYNHSKSIKSNSKDVTKENFQQKNIQMKPTLKTNDIVEKVQICVVEKDQSKNSANAVLHQKRMFRPTNDEKSVTIAPTASVAPTLQNTQMEPCIAKSNTDGNLGLKVEVHVNKGGNNCYIQNENDLTRNIMKKWNMEGIHNPDSNLTHATHLRTRTHGINPGYLEGQGIVTMSQGRKELSCRSPDRKRPKEGKFKDDIENLERQLADIKYNMHQRIQSLRARQRNKASDIQYLHGKRLRNLRLQQEMEIRNVYSMRMINPLWRNTRLMQLRIEHQKQFSHLQSLTDSELNTNHDYFEHLCQEEEKKYQQRQEQLNSLVKQMAANKHSRDNSHDGPHVTAHLVKGPCQSNKYQKSQVPVCLPANIVTAILHEEEVYNTYYEY